MVQHHEEEWEMTEMHHEAKVLHEVDHEEVLDESHELSQNLIQKSSTSDE
jgi:hypothetical protein